MPRIAVVTGFYNRGPLLQRTVSSILEQTFTDFELRVFDDKSTDGTSDLLAELAEERDDTRFYYEIHQENKGFVRGLRDSIASTDSEYIAIQGSGDVSLPDRLLKQAQYLDENPDVAVVGGWYYNVQEDQGTRRLRSPNAEGLGLKDLIKANVFSHGEVMIRRSAYDQVGGYRTIFKYAQDRDLWLRLARAGYGFGTVQEALYERYVQFDGVSYVPAKIAEQACYSIAAERLVQFEPHAESEAVHLIANRGVEAFVPREDSVVQGKLLRAAVRMIVFGSPNGGATIARESILNWEMRAPVLALAWLYQSPLHRVVHFLVGKAARLNSGE